MGHSHAHHQTAGEINRAFAIGVGLNLALVIGQAVYGVLAGSLALMADAGHNLSDVLGLLLAWGASRLARRVPTRRHTYGFRGASILAALTNSVLLLVVTGGIAWEAVLRLQHPAPVAGAVVAWAAAAGVVVNAGSAALFLSGRRGDLNLNAAFLHLLGDAAVSLGVLAAGLGIRLGGWLWLDPLASLLVVVVIVAGTWGVLRESLALALGAVPEGIDSERVEAYLAGLPGVTEVHDLHIWGMSTTEAVLTAHIVLPGLTDDDALICRTCRELHDRFGIEHATLQLEHGTSAYPCHLAPPDVV